MQNKSFYRNLRLTVPEHYHSRRNLYMRPERKELGMFTHLFLSGLVILIFVGV